VQIDHRIPIARGGKHQRSNLAVACSRCNAIKGMWTESEFRRHLALLESVHPAARQDHERRLIAGAARYASKRQSGRKAGIGPSLPG
jgi:hypothetical protein